MALTFGSCNGDDDEPDVTPPRDRGEQQIIDNDSLVGYLQTHYYNSSFFENNSDPRMDDIIISELPMDNQGNYLALPDPDNNTLLSEAVETKTTIHADAEYEYYVLKINQGGGAENPNFCDDVRVNYRGNTQDEEIFDSTVIPLVILEAS